MIKSTAAKNAACNAIVHLVDQGSTFFAGRVNLFTHDSSTYPDATAISYLWFSNPAFRDATDGTSVSNFINDATAFFDGTLSWFNVINRDASEVWRGTVSTLSGLGDMKLNVLVFPKDTTVSISSATFVVPA